MTIIVQNQSKNKQGHKKKRIFDQVVEVWMSNLQYFRNYFIFQRRHSQDLKFKTLLLLESVRLYSSVYNARVPGSAIPENHCVLAELERDWNLSVFFPMRIFQLYLSMAIDSSRLFSVGIHDKNNCVESYDVLVK